MSDISTRVTELSPARRKLLEGLLRTKPQPLEGGETTSDQPLGKASGRADSKWVCQQFFNSINHHLDQTLFGRFSFHLNFGYIPDNNPQFSAATLPRHLVNRNSIKLVLEVVGKCPLQDQRILDVGCGRGGTAAAIQEFFQPKHFTGVDLSSNAVKFCNANHRYTNVEFRQADAENLPFQNSSMDVVINIESSSSYPNIRDFYLEVFRVLAPGGYFLYSDVLHARQFGEYTALLKAIGFDILEDRDITSNVLLSCDEAARNRTQAYDGTVEMGMLTNFLGTPGSHVYEDMKTGNRTYRILQLYKAPRDMSYIPAESWGPPAA